MTRTPRWTTATASRWALAIASAFALAFALILAAGEGSAEQTQAGDVPTRLSLSPLSNISPAGSAINIDVLIDSVYDFGGYELDIAYDPKILQFEGWEDADFLIGTSRSQLCSEPSSPSAGLIRVACSTIDQKGPAGPSGSGKIGELSFTTSCAGSDTVTFRNTSISDTMGTDILHIRTHGSFVLLNSVGDLEICPAATPTLDGTPQATLSPAASPTSTPTNRPAPPTSKPPNGCGDLDGSGTVDAIDAALLLFEIAGLIPKASSPSNADVDNSGSLDSIDVLQILQVSAGLISKSTLRCG